MHFPCEIKGTPVYGVLVMLEKKSVKSYNHLLSLLQEHSSFLTQSWPSLEGFLSSIWN